MAEQRRGVTLIGMPGAGKSTVGVLLSKRLALDFVDSDLAIQVREGRTLQQLIDAEGHLRLREIEAAVLLGIDPLGRVVATGGSAVYSDEAMRHLAAGSTIVYLDVALAELRRHSVAQVRQARVPGAELRGTVRRAHAPLSALRRAAHRLRGPRPGAAARPYRRRADQPR